ncbi:MAG TPA: alpha/beta fold hydrolase [Solirubrobacteraceae bacterium]|jgi:pimeloyl-ACP methyl ester carboxylesterase
MIAIDVSGSGEPLVLFHGVGASRIVWRHVTPLLAPRRMVIAPDLPGFGESAPAGPGFDLGRTAVALAEPLAERAGRRFDLVGNSLGGAVAVELAALRPDLIRRLVLSAPAGFTAPRPALADVAGVLLGPLTTLRREIGVPLATSPTARRVLLFGAIAEPRRLSASDARTMLEASRGSTRIGAAVETLLRSDLSPVLERVEAPVGVIWGAHDRVVPIATLRRIREIRDDVAVEILDDAAHVPQLEHPVEFVDALERLFDQLG